MDKFSKHFPPLILIIFQCLTGQIPFFIHLLGLVFFQGFVDLNENVE